MTPCMSSGTWPPAIRRGAAKNANSPRRQTSTLQRITLQWLHSDTARGHNKTAAGRRIHAYLFVEQFELFRKNGDPFPDGSQPLDLDVLLCSSGLVPGSSTSPCFGVS